MLNIVNLRFFHLIGGKYINGRRLEPFGEVCAGPPAWTTFSLDMFFFFPKITNKIFIAENQAKKKKKKIKNKKKKKK